jgi:hypothetical protein
MNSVLKKLIESEVRRALKEAITEPSEQIIKGAMEMFRQQTGINVATPVITTRDANSIVYTTSLDREVRSNIMKSLFKSLSLRVSVFPMPEQIGAYSFVFEYVFKHPGKKLDTIDIGTISYQNNKFEANITI